MDRGFFIFRVYFVAHKKSKTNYLSDCKRSGMKRAGPVREMKGYEKHVVKARMR
jgi:hypothetical protein